MDMTICILMDIVTNLKMAKTKIEVDLVIKGGESVEQVENKTKKKIVLKARSKR